MKKRTNGEKSSTMLWGSFVSVNNVMKFARTNVSKLEPPRCHYIVSYQTWRVNFVTKNDEQKYCVKCSGLRRINSFRGLFLFEHV